MTPEQVDEWINRVVAAAPPLSDEVAAKIAALMPPPRAPEKPTTAGCRQQTAA